MEAPDAMAPAFGMAALGAAFVVLFAAYRADVRAGG
jgi:hypothetical protein